MGVIGHQGPGIDFGFCIRGKISKAGYKILSVILIIDYFSLFYPPDDNMVQGSWGIQPGLAGYNYS